MFKHIMVPFDLSAKDKWAKAVKIAADIARQQGSRMTLVSVGGGINGKVSHSIGEYRRLLAVEASEIERTEGIDVDSRAYNVADPSVEVDRKLVEAIDDIGADLVVMASHQPGWVEYLINSHAGRLAAHAPVSVFVVRD